MATRVNIIGDACLVERGHLPAILTQALQTIPTELKALGFDTKQLDASQWVWNWNPDFDGDFQRWLKGDVIGLSWPDCTGISVYCGCGACLIFTGIRWDSFYWVEQTHVLIRKLGQTIVESLNGKRMAILADGGESEVDIAQDLFFDGASFDELSKQSGILISPTS